MAEPLLLDGANVWTIHKAGERLEARLICTALPTDGLISYVKYDSSSGLLFAGTQSKGIIVIRSNQVRPIKNSASPPDQPTAYYSQVALPDGHILTSSGHLLPEGQKRASPTPLHTPFNNFV